MQPSRKGNAAQQEDAEVPDPGRQAGGTAEGSWALSESPALPGPSHGLWVSRVDFPSGGDCINPQFCGNLNPYSCQGDFFVSPRHFSGSLMSNPEDSFD